MALVSTGVSSRKAYVRVKAAASEEGALTGAAFSHSVATRRLSAAEGEELDPKERATFSTTYERGLCHPAHDAYCSRSLGAVASTSETLIHKHIMTLKLKKSLFI